MSFFLETDIGYLRKWLINDLSTICMQAFDVRNRKHTIALEETETPNNSEKAQRFKDTKNEHLQCALKNSRIEEKSYIRMASYL